MLGKLKMVSVREAWPNEAANFTPWLAEDENLSLLGDEIGIPLELIKTEYTVGSFSADIIAKSSDSEETVVIENQFGNTDHRHLGQILTYAAGVGSDGIGAKTMVWIAEQFREEHRAALDWLNRSTEPGIRFFGIELQLWRIEQSPLAPKFNVVCRPNDPQKRLTQETAAALSAASQLYKDFWCAFIEFCGEHTTLLLPSDPPADNWIAANVLRSGFGVHLSVSKRDLKLECQLWINHSKAKPAFAELLSHKDQIVTALGNQVEFDEMSSRTPCKIFQTTIGNVANRSEWPAIHNWLKQRGEAYVSVFTPLVRDLKLD